MRQNFRYVIPYSFVIKFKKTLHFCCCSLYLIGYLDKNYGLMTLKKKKNYKIDS